MIVQLLLSFQRDIFGKVIKVIYQSCFNINKQKGLFILDFILGYNLCLHFCIYYTFVSYMFSS